MALIGLLFIIAAGVVTAGALYDGGEDASVEVLGTTVNTTIAGVFGVGLVCGLLFLLGLWMIAAGTTRSRRKRLDRKAARARHRDSVAQMEEERAQLRAENEELHDRLARGETGPGPDPTGTQAWRPGETEAPPRYDDPGTRSDTAIDTESSRRREGV